MRLLIIAFIILFVVGPFWENPNANLYILHTRDGDIRCNYHNSRDLNNGWLFYDDATTKETKKIEGWKLDSVTVLAESLWSCGPRDEKIKYREL